MTTATKWTCSHCKKSTFRIHAQIPGSWKSQLRCSSCNEPTDDPPFYADTHYEDYEKGVLHAICGTIEPLTLDRLSSTTPIEDPRHADVLAEMKAYDDDDFKQRRAIHVDLLVCIEKQKEDASLIEDLQDRLSKIEQGSTIAVARDLYGILETKLLEEVINPEYAGDLRLRTEAAAKANDLNEAYELLWGFVDVISEVPRHGRLLDRSREVLAQAWDSKEKMSTMKWGCCQKAGHLFRYVTEEEQQELSSNCVDCLNEEKNLL